MEEKLCK